VRRFLIKSGLSGFVLFAFIFGYGRFCDYFFNQTENLDLSEKKQWVLAQKGGVYDYAVLGSSRAYGAFDMNLLDSLTQKEGINLGSNGSGFKDNYLVLSHFLKSNILKELYLQVDMNSLNSKESFSNEFHSFTFMPYWEDAEVKSVLRDELPVLDNRLTDYFPEWRYFYFNKYFSPKEVIRRKGIGSKQVDPYSDLKGGMSSDSRLIEQGVEKLELRKAPNSIDPNDRKYLNRIIQLSKEKGVEIKLFTAPIYKGDHKYLKEAISDLNIIKYFPDPSFEMGLSYFQDQGHLNRYGRNKFTVLFFNYLN